MDGAIRHLRARSHFFSCLLTCSFRTMSDSEDDGYGSMRNSLGSLGNSAASLQSLRAALERSSSSLSIPNTSGRAATTPQARRSGTSSPVTHTTQSYYIFGGSRERAEQASLGTFDSTHRELIELSEALLATNRVLCVDEHGPGYNSWRQVSSEHGIDVQWG